MNRYFIENSNTILRKVLNKEENLDIVKDFIEAILRIEIQKVILRPYLGDKIKYLPKEQKYGVVNVRIIDKENRQFNVGIQIIDGFFAQEKLLIYGASIHANQTEYDDYNNIVNTLTINILNHRVFSTLKCHKLVTLSAKDSTGQILLNHELEFHVLQLPDYHENGIVTREDEWIQYLKGEDIESIEKIKKNNKTIKKLDNILINFWQEEDI